MLFIGHFYFKIYETYYPSPVEVQCMLYKYIPDGVQYNHILLSFFG